MRIKNVKEHRFNLPWTISALNCKPSIDFANIGQSAPLVWRVGREEPNECATDGQPQTQRTEYLGLLASYYAKEQLADRCGVESIILNPDDTHELYLLFTFQESKYAYIITPIEFTSWYGDREIHYCNMNGVFLFLQIPGKYDFVIRYDRKDHTDINGKRYTIKIDSWDKISVQKLSTKRGSLGIDHELEKTT